MLGKKGNKTHGFQLTQAIKSLSQGIEIQVRFECTVILSGAHF